MGTWFKLTLCGVCLLMAAFAFGGSREAERLGSLDAGAMDAGGMDAAQATLRGPWATWANPAGLASLGAPMAGLSATRPFSLAGMDQAKGLFAWPLGKGGMAVYTQHNGDVAFRRWMTGLAYGMHLGPYLSLGLSAEYQQTSIREYGHAGNLGLSLGLQAMPSERWVLGAWVQNPHSPQRGSEKADRIPASLVLGVQHRMGDRLSLAVEASKSPDQVLAWQVLLSVQALENLNIQGGWAGGPTQWLVGLNYRLGAFQSGFLVRTHPLLGFSPGFSTSWFPRKRAKTPAAP